VAQVWLDTEIEVTPASSARGTGGFRGDQPVLALTGI
jgi:hypothetical protein